MGAYGLKFRCAFQFIGLGEDLASLVVAGVIARRESRTKLTALDAIAGDLLLDALGDDAMRRDGLPEDEDADRQWD